MLLCERPESDGASSVADNFRFDEKRAVSILAGAGAQVWHTCALGSVMRPAPAQRLYNNIPARSTTLVGAHRAHLLYWNHPSTLFTAVVLSSMGNGGNVFKIIALRVSGLKTFWTIGSRQVFYFDSQMTMAAPYPGVRVPYEHKLTMIAGSHRASHPQKE